MRSSRGLQSNFAMVQADAKHISREKLPYHPVQASSDTSPTTRRRLGQWQEQQRIVSFPTKSKRPVSLYGGFGVAENYITQSAEDDLNAPMELNEDVDEWDYGSDLDFQTLF